jgi:heptosyltransferase-1
LNILVVKLSSLGDVVHTMPAVQDLHRALPQARIDWVVERAFAPLVRQVDGVERVIEVDLRRWRKSPFAVETRRAWRAFRTELAARGYDAVIDLQGLTKSALVSRLARLAPGGRRIALGNRTDGSSWERPTRWVADLAVEVPSHTAAVARARIVCAQAFGYAVPPSLRYGLRVDEGPAAWQAAPFTVAEQGTEPMVAKRLHDAPTVALVHGTSRADKLWPEGHWIELGQGLLREGFALALPHGNAEEEARSHRLAQALGPAATVWPRLPLDALMQQLASTAGVIGVDSGLSHIAVALDLPHVQIYNFDTAWRTGPAGSRRQTAVFAQPTPSVAQVQQAWADVMLAAQASTEQAQTPGAGLRDGGDPMGRTA